MPAFIATIELKDITASEFEYIDSALLEASFICIKKDSTNNQQKDNRSGAYIKRGTNITTVSYTHLTLPTNREV